MKQIENTNPPIVRWMDVDYMRPKGESLTLLYGIVNIGSPNEHWSTFIGKWSEELNKWLDKDGEVIDHEVRHWLVK